ncbi:MAG: 50S ribosomal protein L10 [Nanoarchaeota archaeon]
MKTKAVAKWKQKEIGELKELSARYKTIAIVDLKNLPNKQLQIARKKLRGKIVFKLTKKSLIVKAFKDSGKEFLTKLSAYLSGTPAVIFTDIDAFELFRLLKQNRQFMAAKPGQTAPNDLWAQAGPTPFVPGPIISDLGKLGIKNKVEAGKIVFINDTLIVKEGAIINETAASMLGKLGIEPIEVKVKMTFGTDNGEIYAAKVMNIDPVEIAAKIRQAARDAFNLTVGLGIVNKENASYLIGKAYRDTKALADKIGLGKDESQALKSEIKEE